MFAVAISVAVVATVILGMRLCLMDTRRARPLPASIFDPPDAHPPVVFAEGLCYYDARLHRVFQCIRTKGRKARLAFFASLDRIDADRRLAAEGDFGYHHIVRDDGVETCRRGALRADREATDKEVSEELDFLLRLRGKSL